MKKQKNIQINTNKGNEIMNIKLIQFLCIGLAVFLMSCDVPKRAAALEKKLDDIGDSQTALNKKIDNMLFYLRIFFHEIKKDLENGVFDIFDINPLTITEAIKGEYVKLLKKHKKAKKGYWKKYNRSLIFWFLLGLLRLN